MFSNTPISKRHARNQVNIHAVPSDQPSHPIRRLNFDQDPNSVEFSETTGQPSQKVLDNMFAYDQMRRSQSHDSTNTEMHNEEKRTNVSPSKKDRFINTNNKLRIGSEPVLHSTVRTGDNGGSESTLGVDDENGGGEKHLDTLPVSDFNTPNKSTVTTFLDDTELNPPGTILTPRRLRFFSGNLGEPRRTPRPQGMLIGIYCFDLVENVKCTCLFLFKVVNFLFLFRHCQPFSL